MLWAGQTQAVTAGNLWSGGQGTAAPVDVLGWKGKVVSPRLHPLQTQLMDFDFAADLCSNRQNWCVLGRRQRSCTSSPPALVENEETGGGWSLG